MDASKYKDKVTSRGIRYHYYLSSGASNLPSLLFLHGFPSTSLDWRYQVQHFESKGYGVVVPDMLGYGGTDKPDDLMEYRASLITKDLVEILDEEKLDRVIAVGHDWGSKITSRLANYYPERFVAFGFLAVGYGPPQPTKVPITDALAFMKKLTGSELFGYGLFFAEDGAVRIIEDHFDSFMSLLFPKDPELWVEHLCPSGAAKAWIMGDKTTERAEYISDEDFEKHGQALKSGGLAGPLCWYKILITDIDFDDDRAVPQENIEINKPVFFGAAKLDYVARPELHKHSIEALCKNATIASYDASHWVMLHRPRELNKDLESWIETLSVSL